MENIFEEELARSTIFLDRNVLSPHYVPEHLPYREAEITKIMKTLAPALSQKRPNNLFLYGKTGTGKTSCTRHVLKKLDEVKKKYDAKVDSIYINCRQYNKKYQVLLKCAERTKKGEDVDFRGYQPTHLYEKILKYVAKNELMFFIVLDEIDKVKDVDDLVYALTRANDDLAKGHIGIIGISNNIKFKDKLDARTKSTLCQEEMVFAPYNAAQLAEILKERTKEGFKKGLVEAGAVSLAAAFAAQESGDARYALRLLLKAGEIADETETRVTAEDVRTARRIVEEDIVLELINTLPEHQGIVLYSIATLNLEGGSKYTKLTGERDKSLFSGEIYEAYEKLCKKWKVSARSARWFREYISELEMMGLITTTMSGKGIRGNTRLIKLAFPAEKVKAVVHKRFD